MANYAVRIYDPEMKGWLIAEAARRGRGVRTSDIVEAALRFYQGHTVDEGSLAGEAVVQPLPAVDPTRGMDARIEELNAVTRRAVARGNADDGARPGDLVKQIQPGLVYAPVKRVKGPDSGPDDELGF
jgi:hypothetical protein